MKKRRITLNLDEDVVEALQALGGRSMSAAANEALRRAAAVEAHRSALARWLAELDVAHGRAGAERFLIEELVDGLVEPLGEAP